VSPRGRRQIPEAGHSAQGDLWLLAHGYETGWWGEDGHPAP
jgi:hypothetical protein